MSKTRKPKRALNPEPREIDYRIRPAKNVERKMLLEICSRMGSVEDLANYRYVGMGSIYFVDFALFHRAFGIESMVSLEGRENLMARCEWNRPFDCIEVRSTTVERALPELRSDTPTIMWLDYEDKLDAPILSQVSEACEILAPRSILMVTINASPDPLDTRVDRFRDRFGNRDLGRVNKPEHLGNIKLRQLSHQYLGQAVSDAVENRAKRDGLDYRQIAYFTYKDGARMLTVAWVFYDGADAKVIDNCGFDRLGFASEDDKPFEIEIPRLTYRERLSLDRLLPEGRLDDRPESIGVEEAEAYSLLYRQMPVYVDAVI